LQGQVYQPITFGKNTIVPRLSAALKLGSGAVPLYDQVPLGGFLNLSGLRRGVLFGENNALAELVYYRKIAEMTPGIGRGIYGGLSLEAGEVWNDSRDFHLGDAVFAGSVFIGADTLFGAVYLGVGAADRGDTAVYLQLEPLFQQGRRQK
jgi:NTE family protein